MATIFGSDLDVICAPGGFRPCAEKIKRNKSGCSQSSKIHQIWEVNAAISTYGGGRPFSKVNFFSSKIDFFERVCAITTNFVVGLNNLSEVVSPCKRFGHSPRIR